MNQHLWRPYVKFRVIGRPATFATSHEHAWKDAVRAAIKETGIAHAASARFRVAITFFTAVPTRPDEQWDIDNLAKPTLDAMEGIFGVREWRGIPQPKDDRVDELHLVKRASTPSEPPGAEVEVWIVDDSR